MVLIEATNDFAYLQDEKYLEEQKQALENRVKKAGCEGGKIQGRDGKGEIRISNLKRREKERCCEKDKIARLKAE